MGRLTAFASGVIVGAVVSAVVLKFHVVRAQDGVHFIPKASATLSYPYTDIRGFGISEWSDRQDLLLAIIRAEKGHLAKEAAIDNLQKAIGNMFGASQSGS